jgi:hypothetical protein
VKQAVLASVFAPMLLLQADTKELLTSPTDWEFGQIHLGEYRQHPPRNATQFTDCGDKRDRMTCSMTLGDGVWYWFENNRLVWKSMNVHDRRRPSWIDPNDSPAQCKARLERIMKLPFRIFKDDYGGVQVETIDLVSTRNGFYYLVRVYFKRGRMTEVEMTPLPDPDS